MNNAERVRKVRSPYLRPMARNREALTVIDGTPRRLLLDLIRSINSQRGTPQSTVDWSDPDTWIDERLKGEPARWPG